MHYMGGTKNCEIDTEMRQRKEEGKFERGSGKGGR